EAQWLLERRELLGKWAVHVDQVSMLLALRAGRRRFCPLPLGANLPTHIPSLGNLPAAAIGPVLALHYHDHVTPQGLLMRVGIPGVDAAIDRVNEAISDELRQFFPNATFWAWRYGRNLDLGSGIGSRGVRLQEKRDLIHLISAAVEPRSTLDVGCGDGAAVDGIALGRYLGLDLAPNAGAFLTDGKPVVCRAIEATDSADLTLCLDVGIHQSNADAWEQLVTRVVASARSVALVSGYESRPSPLSPMVHFHNPLSEVLARHAPGRWPIPVREDQGVVTWAVLATPTPRHSRDLRPETVALLPNDLLLGAELAALLACAWNTTGFYPDHLPRVWEYPTVLRLLRQVIPPGGSVLDVGAGINPLSPMLSRLGFKMTTVDPGPEVRFEERGRWNEWGYLDYSRLGVGVQSVHSTLTGVSDGFGYDAVISISVIEHLRAVERRGMLHEIRSRCRRDALAVLTVDVCAGRDLLWNRCQGQDVESFDEHGRWDDLLDEVTAAGFETVVARIVRLAGHSHVDVGYVVARPK
ncbi:MAG: class I SAM-dependent methyltransferase, partial [Acidobacteriia bacterium]|nr:class I SAM-dependent methyltransferase [Terriglobia bacterium]